MDPDVPGLVVAILVGGQDQSVRTGDGGFVAGVAEGYRILL